MNDDNGSYVIGAGITGFFVFIVSWIYCIYNYGFLIGVGLGWLPALITAVILGALWPLIALIILILIGIVIISWLGAGR